MGHLELQLSTRWTRVTHERWDKCVVTSLPAAGAERLRSEGYAERSTREVKKFGTCMSQVENSCSGHTCVASSDNEQ